MKKTIKAIALSAAVLTLFAANASAKKADKAAKPAKEKAAKPAKAKPVKKTKFDQKGFDAAYAGRDYAACAGMLLGKNNDKTLVKDLLDADMLIYLAKNYQESGKGFLETYGKMQETTAEMTGGKGLAAALGGENALKYYGAEYERYLAWSMRLVNAFNSNQSDVAQGVMKDYTGTFMAEIQALRAQNDEMEKGAEAALSSKEFNDAVKILEEGKINLGISAMLKGRPAKSKEKYEDSAFFNYLGTLAYAVNGDFDHAADFANLKKVRGASAFTKAPAGAGHLEVVALSGLIGKRTDAGDNTQPKSVTFAVPQVMKTVTLYTKLAYPEFKAQKHAINGVKITLSNGASAQAALIENFDEAVRIDVAQKAYGAYCRSIFRNVLKNSVATGSILASGAAMQAAAGNPITAKAAEIAFDKAVDAAAEALVSIEKADIRQGEYFPHKASAAGFDVEPGTYTVTVEYLNGSDIVDTKTIENVVVEEGKVNVAVSACER